MTGALTSTSRAADDLHGALIPGESLETRSKWPRVIGTLGVVLGVLMILDTLDDVLFQLFWNQDDWAAWVGADIARSIFVSMPPPAWAL